MRIWSGDILKNGNGFMGERGFLYTFCIHIQNGEKRWQGIVSEEEIMFTTIQPGLVLQQLIWLLVSVWVLPRHGWRRWHTDSTFGRAAPNGRGFTNERKTIRIYNNHVMSKYSSTQWRPKPRIILLMKMPSVWLNGRCFHQGTWDICLMGLF